MHVPHNRRASPSPAHLLYRRARDHGGSPHTGRRCPGPLPPPLAHPFRSEPTPQPRLWVSPWRPSRPATASTSPRRARPSPCTTLVRRAASLLAHIGAARTDSDSGRGAVVRAACARADAPRPRPRRHADQRVQVRQLARQRREVRVPPRPRRGHQGAPRGCCSARDPGADRTAQGWDEGVAKMSIGEVRSRRAAPAAVVGGTCGAVRPAGRGA